MECWRGNRQRQVGSGGVRWRCQVDVFQLIVIISPPPSPYLQSSLIFSNLHPHNSLHLLPSNSFPLSGSLHSPLSAGLHIFPFTYFPFISLNDALFHSICTFIFSHPAIYISLQLLIVPLTSIFFPLFFIYFLTIILQLDLPFTCPPTLHIYLHIPTNYLSVHLPTYLQSSINQSSA